MSCRVSKLLNNIIKSHKYPSICMPMSEVNIHTYYRVREDAPQADVVVFDRGYDKFNSIRTVPYFTTGTDIILRRMEHGIYKPFTENDFQYVVLYPYDEKFNGLYVIPSACLLDLSKKNVNVLYIHFKYDEYVNWSHNFMTGMLTDFKNK